MVASRGFFFSPSDRVENNIKTLKNKIHIFMPLCNIQYKSLKPSYSLYWLMNQEEAFDFKALFHATEVCDKTARQIARNLPRLY